MVEVKTDVAELKTDVSGLKTDMVEVKTDVAELKTDVSNLKGRAVCDAARTDARIIAERTVKIKYVRILDRSEIHSIVDKAQNKGKTSGISGADLQSFRRADMIIEGMSKGCQHYITVESSYTADNSDARRATRNADYIKRFTGSGSSPVVACVVDKYDKTEYDARPHIITDRALAPE